MDLKRQMYRDNGFVRKFSVLLRMLHPKMIFYVQNLLILKTWIVNT